jgi:hypothetical protein
MVLAEGHHGPLRAARPFLNAAAAAAREAPPAGPRAEPRPAARPAFWPRSASDVLAVQPDGVAPETVAALLEWPVARERPDLTGSANRGGGSGGRLGSFFEVGPRFLKASLHRRFESRHAALALEGRAEARRRQLGIYHRERIWFLSRGSDAAIWACSLTPTLRSLRDALEAGAGREPPEEAWALYLAAFRLSFELAEREGVLLDCNPNNFGIDGGRLLYLDDDLAPATGRAPFGHQLLLRLREYAGASLERRLRFVAAFSDLADALLVDRRLRRSVAEDLALELLWPREPALRRRLRELAARLARERGGG